MKKAQNVLTWFVRKVALLENTFLSHFDLYWNGYFSSAQKDNSFVSSWNRAIRYFQREIMAMIFMKFGLTKSQKAINPSKYLHILVEIGCVLFIFKESLRYVQLRKADVWEIQRMCLHFQ